MPQIQAVLFDCDGTLVDSLPIVREVLREYLSTLDLGISVSDATALFGSGRLGDSVQALARACGRPLPDDFIDELLRRRDEGVRGRLRAVEGAVELVSRLSLPMAVASNAPMAQTRLSLEITGLAPYFGDHVYSAHDLGAWKPAPDLFLHAAARLDVEPAHCAVVEDSPVGAEAGLAAGMTVFGLGPRADVMPAGVRAIQRLGDLAALLSAR